MANEINFGYFTGHTLTYGAYQPDGTVRTAAGTALSEIGTTGYYTATDASIVALDCVIVKDSVTSLVAGWGQYMPPVSAPTITADLVTITTIVNTVSSNVTQLIEDQSMVNNTLEERKPFTQSAEQSEFISL